MKKKIVAPIALLLCLLCMVASLGVFAEDNAPSLEIAYYTVPMRATVSILYAVPAAGYRVNADGTVDGLNLLVWKGEEGALAEAARVESAGLLSIKGKQHLIFVYDGLSAAEMDVKVTARVAYGESMGAPKSYSVADFAADYEGEYEALVAAMIKYGNAVKALKEAPSEVQAEIVNKNGAAGVLTLVSDDGAQRTSDFFLTKIAPYYSAFKVAIAMPTKNIASLKKSADGTEWLTDENGDYVLTVQQNGYSSEFEDSVFYGELADDYATMVDFWKKIEESGAIDLYSHSHTHSVWGTSNEITYNDDGSVKYPKGNVTKELWASAQILRKLIGSQTDVIMRPGGHTDLTSDFFYNLVQNDDTYIAMRSSNGAPPLLTETQNKLNTVAKFRKESERLRIATILVRGYEAAFNADGSGFATTADSTAAECIAAGISAWTNYVDLAIRDGGWASIGFHSVLPDSTTSTKNGYAVFDSQVKALMDYVQPLVESGKLWMPTFDEATKYYFEWSSATVKATAYGDSYIKLSVTDEEEDERFDVALTVKVSVPRTWNAARLDLAGETATLAVHSDDNGSFVYVNIVPGDDVATLTPAS